MRIIEQGYSIIDKIESHPNGTIKWSASTIFAFFIYYIVPVVELYLNRSVYFITLFTFISFIYYTKENSLLAAIKTLLTNLTFIALFLFVLNPLLIVDLLGDIFYLIRARNNNVSAYLDKFMAFLSIYFTFIVTLPILLMVMADCIKLPISD